MGNQQQTGDLMKEVWKDIEDYEGYYQVSSRGRVRSVDRIVVSKTGKKIPYKGKIRTLQNKRGYLQVCLNKAGDSSWFIVHRLVAKAFIPNTNNFPQVNHIDGNKTNNNCLNLEWVTAKDNIRHAYDNDLALKGEDRPQATVSKDTVVKICEALEQGVPSTEIARLLNTTTDVVSKIKSRKCWNDVSENYNFKARHRGLSEETVVAVCELLQQGFSAPYILSVLEDPLLNLSKIYSIRKRDHYTNISQDYEWAHYKNHRSLVCSETSD